MARSASLSALSSAAPPSDRLRSTAVPALVPGLALRAGCDLALRAGCGLALLAGCGLALLAGCGLTLLAGCAPAGPQREPGAAVLVTLDTTRADALGAFGGPAGLTPALDGLAAESLRFPAARTVAPLTLPAHASMLTGLWPPRHGVRDNNVMRLAEAAETLAERAREAGCETAGFVAAAVLSRDFGIAQGFATWSEPGRPLVGEAPAGDGPGPDAADSHYVERSAEAVVADALAWLAGRDPTRPFFLWVHVFEPHNPYVPAPRFRAQAGGDPYHGEIAQADAALAGLLDALRADPWWDRTTVVVTADHGEGLGEHGEPTHSAYVWDTTIRVPLLVRVPPARAPAGWTPGGEDPRVASVVDVHPTLLEALGLRADPGVDGRSLLQPAAELEPARGVYFESYHGWLNYGWAPLAGWADAEAKYVHAPTPLLLDAADLHEREVATEIPPATAERYRRAIAAVADRPALGGTDAERVGEEAVARLQTLGYAAVGDAGAELPHPLAPTDRPDPHARVDEWVELYRAIDLRNVGRTREAIAILERVLAENPENAYALDFLAAALAAEGRLAEAVPVLRRLLAIGRGSRNAHYNLAGCLESTGAVDEALVHYRRAAALDPAHAPTLRRLVALLAGERPREAAKYRRLLAEARR